MPCYKPLTAYYSSKINKTGKRSLVFQRDSALVPVSIPVSCGRCIGCRLDRSLNWAVRCVHESKSHDENSFITLTINDKYLNKTLNTSGTLVVADFQTFMKRLRKTIAPKKVRFFHCGEYGSKLQRPHHHACLFGYDFPDKKIIGQSQGKDVYSSNTLTKLWPLGFHTIGEVNFETASYVARYVLKKWSKDNLSSTELYDQMKIFSDKELKKKYYGLKLAEYVTMSRRPGIGTNWITKFSSDIYPNGSVIINGKKVKPPKFYDSKYELDNPLKFAMLKGQRMLEAQQNSNNSPARLEVRNDFKRLTVTNSRGLENDLESLCTN